MKKDISFMMVAYNEERIIGTALERLVKAVNEYGNAEILVGIDGDDSTTEIAKKFEKQCKNIRIFKFLKKMGRTNAQNFLAEKATSDILVNHGADLVFVGDIVKIVKWFRNPKVGGLVYEDTNNMDSMNQGQVILENTYASIKRRYLISSNKATSPLLYCYIYRKSGLGKPPYFSTSNDDTESTYKLLRNGYDVVYDKTQARCFIDNPSMERLTRIGVIKRRIRGEIFRREAKEKLDTNAFDAKKQVPKFTSAVVTALKNNNWKIRMEIVDYLFFVALGTLIGKVGCSLHIIKYESAWADLRARD
ncbi:MAG: glycosyltransferase [Candidatus Micrarchaeota archaeon]|nr:glycosyltransferase [Candidatus Micrarchaeota archaeon]